MSVLPPPPQSHDELDALIREARARQRRRRLLLAAVIAVAAALGIASWALIPGHTSTGGTADVGGGPGVGQLDGTPSGSTALLQWVGSSGGVTWTADEGHVWLSDGSSTWLSAPPLGVTLTGEVQFVDRSHGWLSANTNRGLEIERTTDGGHTWQASAPPGCTTCAFGEVSFFDAKNGYVLAGATPTYGSPSVGTKLFSTRDGGATWSLVAKLRFGPPAVARFVDPERGVAVKWDPEMGSGHYRVFRTSNGGRTWLPVMLEGKPVYPGWFGVPTVTAVGGTLVIPAERFRSRKSPGRPVVYTSRDGGGHWQAHVAPAKVFFGYGLFSAASPGTWVASDAHGLHFFETTDGGKRWREVTTPGGKGAFFGVRWINFASPLAGWAILEDEELVRTTDGGLHWALAGPPKP